MVRVLVTRFVRLVLARQAAGAYPLLTVHNLDCGIQFGWIPQSVWRLGASLLGLVASGPGDHDGLLAGTVRVGPARDAAGC